MVTAVVPVKRMPVSTAEDAPRTTVIGVTMVTLGACAKPLNGAVRAPVSALPKVSLTEPAVTSAT